MKWPGDILRKRREEFGLSLPELESSSNIPRRNLEALEKDQYDFFAAESYYRGFLKNYAESLKLDPQILLDAYEKVKIVESPLPMEQLTGNSRKSRFSLLRIVVLLLVAVAGISYLVYRQIRGVKSASREQAAETPLQTTTVVVNRYPWIQDLEDALVLRFVLDADLLQPELQVVQTAQSFQLVSLNLDQEYELILATGKTNILPLRFTGSNEQVHLFRLDFTLQNEAALLIDLNNSESPAPQLGNKFATFQPKDSVPHAILQASKPIILQLQLSFQRNNYIRYQWFGQNAQEFPVLKNKVLLLQGEAPLTLWLSDVNATDIKINGQPLVPEAFQNVFVGRLEWKREGRISRLYLIPGL